MGKEITDLGIIKGILAESRYLRLGLCDDGMPYIVPMCYGYEDGYLYLHSSRKGMKIDILRKNRNVCFEIDQVYELLPSENPCSYNMKYQSIVGFGTAEIYEDEEGIRTGLGIIIGHYHERECDVGDLKIGGVAVIRIKINELHCRQNKMD